MEDGELLDADTDYGDNHQSQAAAWALQLLTDALEAAADRRGRLFAVELGRHEFGGDVCWVRQVINDFADHLQREKQLTAEETDDVYAWLQTVSGASDTLMTIATSDHDDSREYAMRNWGWTAVRSDRLETNGLSERKLKRIAAALGEVLDRAGEYAADPDFVLTDHATGRVYHVRLSDLEAADLAQLFRRHSNLVNL